MTEEKTVALELPYISFYIYVCIYVWDSNSDSASYNQAVVGGVGLGPSDTNPLDANVFSSRLEKCVCVWGGGGPELRDSEHESTLSLKGKSEFIKE